MLSSVRQSEAARRVCATGVVGAQPLLALGGRRLRLSSLRGGDRRARRVRRDLLLVALAEPIDPPGRVDELLSARVEGMARAADVDRKVALGGTRDKDV